MVAAGVYMLVRVFFIVGQSPTALTVIAAIGIITAVLAALIATQQDDIKRILAYSTLSQLGYMVAAVGVAAPGAAMFHLFTHAFFKACLFLGAGAVIHALHPGGVQDAPTAVDLGLLEYIPFPDALRGKYQCYTQADLTALREAGCDHAFADVATGVEKYMQVLATRDE